MNVRQKRYAYCSYWGTWSRVLTDNFEGNQTVEVNLTPILRAAETWAERVAPIIIRKHCTSPDRYDIFTNQLPKFVWDRIGQEIGHQLRHRLVTEDFLSQIDWIVYAYQDRLGGGVALNLCRKARAA